MTRVTLITADEQSQTVETDEGSSLMESTRRANVRGIIAKRSGACACATPSLIRGTSTRDWPFVHPFAARLFEKGATLASLGVAETDDPAALIDSFLPAPPRPTSHGRRSA